MFLYYKVYKIYNIDDLVAKFKDESPVKGKIILSCLFLYNLIAAVSIFWVQAVYRDVA